MSDKIDKQRLREAIARHRPQKPGTPKAGGGHAENGGARPPSAPQTHRAPQPGRQGASRERG
jgi:hypothetical protein